MPFSTLPLQIGDVGRCVDNALQLANDLEVERRRASSIIFPLLGTGIWDAREPINRPGADRRGDPLVRRAHPRSNVDTVYVLAFRGCIA
jgi:hypothetical protein